MQLFRQARTNLSHNKKSAGVGFISMAVGGFLVGLAHKPGDANIDEGLLYAGIALLVIGSMVFMYALTNRPDSVQQPDVRAPLVSNTTHAHAQYATPQQEQTVSDTDKDPDMEERIDSGGISGVTTPRRSNQ